MRRVLVTGSSGFIGYHLCRLLLAEGFEVIGLDAMTPYYDPVLKARRRALLRQSPAFRDLEGRVEEPGLLAGLLARERPELVVHLAAQAGVRYSLEAPRSYLEANIAGTFELLEACRATPPAHLLIASTSSVYGANARMPYVETDRTDHQMSFYAASKKATESMAHAYAHLHALPITLFRFFTVYGSWGRPDMAPILFTRAILAGEPIKVFNRGDMRRDFTHVSDLVRGIRLLFEAVPPVPQEREGAGLAGDSLSPVAPWRVVNIGNAQPVELPVFISTLEEALGRKARQELLPMQPGDVPATWADTSLLRALTGFVPATPLAAGVREFVAWYRDYYRA